MRVLCGCLALIAGCYHLEQNFVPDKVVQEIGVNHLPEATHTWTCEGDEQLGTLPNGKLYVASQDFQVPKVDAGDGLAVFGYKRPSDGWFPGAGSTARYYVPDDPNDFVVAQYGTDMPDGFDAHRYVTVTYSTSGDVETRTTTSGVHYTPRYGFMSVVSEFCFPSTETPDRDAFVQRSYNGIAIRTQPPEGHHFKIAQCASNMNQKQFISDRTTNFTSILDASGKIAGGPDMAFVPQDYWITDDHRVTARRIDGLTFDLVTPRAIGGSDGWLFERAWSPIYVNPALGEESIYLYPMLSAMTDDDTPYVLGCLLEAAE